MRFNLGLAAVQESGLPAIVSLLEQKLANAGWTPSLGAGADTRKIAVCFQWRENNGNLTGVTLGGFALEKIGNAGQNLNGSSTWNTSWWWIDAGIGSVLENVTSAALAWTGSTAAFTISLWRIEHAQYAVDFNVSGLFTPAASLAGSIIEQDLGAAIGSIWDLGDGSLWSAVPVWTGLTRDDLSPPNSFTSLAHEAPTADTTKIVSVSLSPSTRAQLSLVSFGKGPYPTWEYQNYDRQDSVIGDTQIATLPIGAGEGRKCIVAASYCNVNIPFVSMKCAGVDMNLAGKVNKDIGGHPVSVALWWLPLSDLPDPSATSAEFRSRLGSSNFAGVMAAGITRGGIGKLMTGSYYGPGVSIGAATWAKRSGVVLQIGGIGGTQNWPAGTPDYDLFIDTGLPTDLWGVSLLSLTTGLPFSSATPYANWFNSDVNHISTASHAQQFGVII